MRRLVLAAPALAALVLASGAGAATPRFAVYNLRLALAPASHNAFGDIKVWKQRDALARHASGAALVRCGTGCPFTSGWFAFSGSPALGGASLASARAERARGSQWSLTLQLTARGRARWAAAAKFLARRQRERGVPDVLAFVVDGAVVAAPFADQVRHPDGTLVVPGLTKANALRAAKLLG